MDFLALVDGLGIEVDELTRRVLNSPASRPHVDLSTTLLLSNLRQEALLTEIRDLLAAGSASPPTARTSRKRAPKAG